MEVSQGWLGNLVAFLETHPRIGAVGPLTSTAMDMQSVDRVRERMVPQIPHFLTADIHERNRVLRFHFHRAGILVDGALDLSCAVLKRRAVEAVGDLNGTVAGRCDDGDYCRRLRKAGYVLGLVLDTYVVRQSDGTSREVLSGGRRRETRRAAGAC
jgi:GT2 family glycosyltransferase